ncbi:hypothetical protein AMAG_11957 [Allomyces macrogynus ATCC 38327]|uniref:Uncharacterized protein n=1 Tax=Allomyces macrogynus (strain ATCC 38327) TaxID=578462 RepID=A0A0L0SY95_ALLM3|nr:hypothetical protein AMAG_11957 [Allomyces macrogynus ATCC 38327]|eukprot:KNE67498.1 hypothetical protein AMAG_11957 [Allomyces macrogynus ATCC 38327]
MPTSSAHSASPAAAPSPAPAASSSTASTAAPLASTTSSSAPAPAAPSWFPQPQSHARPAVLPSSSSATTAARVAQPSGAGFTLPFALRSAATTTSANEAPTTTQAPAPTNFGASVPAATTAAPAPAPSFGAPSTITAVAAAPASPSVAKTAQVSAPAPAAPAAPAAPIAKSPPVRFGLPADLLASDVEPTKRRMLIGKRRDSIPGGDDAVAAASEADARAYAAERAREQALADLAERRTAHADLVHALGLAEAAGTRLRACAMRAVTREVEDKRRVLAQAQDSIKEEVVLRWSDVSAMAGDAVWRVLLQAMRTAPPCQALDAAQAGVLALMSLMPAMSLADSGGSDTDGAPSATRSETTENAQLLDLVVTTARKAYFQAARDLQVLLDQYLAKDRRDSESPTGPEPNTVATAVVPVPPSLLLAPSAQRKRPASTDLAQNAELPSSLTTVRDVPPRDNGSKSPTDTFRNPLHGPKSRHARVHAWVRWLHGVLASLAPALQPYGLDLRVPAWPVSADPAPAARVVGAIHEATAKWGPDHVEWLRAIAKSVRDLATVKAGFLDWQWAVPERGVPVPRGGVATVAHAVSAVDVVSDGDEVEESAVVTHALAPVIFGLPADLAPDVLAARIPTLVARIAAPVMRDGEVDEWEVVAPARVVVTFGARDTTRIKVKVPTVGKDEGEDVGGAASTPSSLGFVPVEHDDGSQGDGDDEEEEENDQ